MKVIAHRGKPENTVRGIREALAHGADAIEFDVRLHPCGELLLMHDTTLDRTTDGTGAFRDVTFDDIRRLDAGLGERVPTLDEALDAVGSRPAFLEIKTDGPRRDRGAAEAVAAVLAKRDSASVTVSSFDLPELARFKGASPRHRVSALLDGVPLDMSAPLAVGATSIGVSADYVDSDTVDLAKKNGLETFVWTVNSVARAAELSGMVDGVFTDCPRDMPRLKGTRT
jgi:glycerophosphoryl diester phosphodiesterase